MARNPNRGSRSNKPKTYTDKNRPSGFYNVAGKGKRYWNAYTKSWSKSPLGSTDKMLSKATGRDVTATTQRIKRAVKAGARGGAKGGSKGPLKIKAASNSGTPRSRTENRRSTTSSSSNSSPKRPVGRNWSKGYGAKSDKPSSGDPSTWKKKEKPATPIGDKATNATPARLKHGMNTARISELMTKWKAAKGADKDRLGRQIHRLKYEKTEKGLKIRKKPLSKAGELGWKGRTEA